AGRPLHRWHQARHAGDRQGDPGPALPRAGRQGQGGHARRVVPRPRERLIRMGARTKARKRAADILFEAEQRRWDAVRLLRERIEKPLTESPVPQYAADIVEGVVAHRERIDELLETYSNGWTIERMPAVDRALLR